MKENTEKFLLNIWENMRLFSAILWFNTIGLLFEKKWKKGKKIMIFVLMLSITTFAFGENQGIVSWLKNDTPALPFVLILFIFLIIRDILQKKRKN